MLIYILAWLTFFTAFAAAFFVTNQKSVLRAAAGPFLVVAPAALLGIAVIWMCRFVPLPGFKQPKFFIVHLTLAFVYSITWIAIVYGTEHVINTLMDRSYSIVLPSEQTAHWHFLAGSMIYFTLVSVTYTIDRAAKADVKQRQAEIWLLRAKLNPHFLFNTLHSLLALVRHEPDAAEKSLGQFAELLRYTLRINRDALDDITLAEEWAFTRSYLDLERLRLGDRLCVEADFDESSMDCFVPVFLLQPLVENAIRYAVAPRAAGGTIWINARCENDNLIIEIRDDGTGKESPASHHSSGMGLRITGERLRHYYGRNAQFETRAEPESGFTVTICIPARDEPLS